MKKLSRHERITRLLAQAPALREQLEWIGKDDFVVERDAASITITNRTMEGQQLVLPTTCSVINMASDGALVSALREAINRR